MENRVVINDEELLKKFNDRDPIAFGQIYKILYKELNAYAAILYREEKENSQDYVHDAFLNLWLSKMNFTQLEGIKAYIYVSIKNRYKNFIIHSQYVEEYTRHVENNYDINVIESEVYSLVDQSMKVLPQKYAKVLKMYIDGWKSGEIANEFGETEQNIYNIKHKALKLLKKKINSDTFIIIQSICLTAI